VLRVSRQVWNGLCWFLSRTSQHGATDGRTQAKLIRPEEEWSEVREVGVEAGREHDASPEEGDAEERQRPEGEEPQAGDRDRAVRGAVEGGEGAAQARREEVVIAQVEQPEEDGAEEERPEVFIAQLVS
jgi:hypothetical protein